MKKANYILLITCILLIFSKLTGEPGKLYISEKRSAAIEKSAVENISGKQLGSFVENGKTFFRLFSPNAAQVKLVTFNHPGEEPSAEFNMEADDSGVWETSIPGELYGVFYGYRVYHKGDEKRNGSAPICVDPYAKSVASFTSYMNPRLSMVYNDEYDWEDDSWIMRDWSDLIIYEMHIRDMTAHKSSGSSHPGTYKGLVEKGITGGLEYIKKLGVNTVELLPAMEYATVEIPFNDSLEGRFNTWNPYERNHWGYMTAAFFAPEAYYSESTNGLARNEWIGVSGKQVTDFKDMVKAFHREGIGVMMDVVYNHLSEYELGNLKQIDLDYYFRLDNHGECIAQSGCGNDLKTENPMVRRLIVDSILFWMKEYHIDGFRFDLGKLLDWETIEEIIYEAKKINPNVVFVCEPWGGGYDPKGFSLRGWGAWNDQIRNGIKGQNPVNGLGWIFGKWYGNNDRERIKSYVNGTLVRDKYGLFQNKSHSVNYLESHDDYTLGDFIRIGTGRAAPDEVISDLTANAALPDNELRLNKLAALFLLTSQGITMISEGQEFARSKVISAFSPVNDPQKGQLDHNSYNKDNETNYINFDQAAANNNLLEYYSGLIELRKNYPAFRQADYEDIEFIEPADNQFVLGYRLTYGGAKFLVLFNADQNNNFTFTLDDGDYSVFVDHNKAGIEPLANVSGQIELPPVSGMALLKE